MTNSVLTDDQRQFLEVTEEERQREYSKQDRHYYRKQIKQRVEQGVADISILLDRWDPEERADIFSSSGELWTATSTADASARPVRSVDSGLIDMVAFVWSAARDGGHTPEDIIREGIRKAAAEEHREYWIDVNLSVEMHSPEKDPELAKLKMRQGEPLTDAEQSALLEDAEVPPDVLAAYVRGDLEEWEPGAEE
jgi:hypothetical protein